MTAAGDATEPARPATSVLRVEVAGKTIWHVIGAMLLTMAHRRGQGSQRSLDDSGVGPVGAFVALPVAALVSAGISNCVKSHDIVYRSEYDDTEPRAEMRDSNQTAQVT